MNKLQRKLLKQKKYFRRLKRIAQYAQVYDEDGEFRDVKNWTELINHPMYIVYKTTSTPCSCWMCSCYKYDRARTKRESKEIIRNQSEERSEPVGE